MPRYRYTGTEPLTFPSLSGHLAPVLGNATLEPGDVVEIPDMEIEPGQHLETWHPLLEETDDPATVRDVVIAIHAPAGPDDPTVGAQIVAAMKAYKSDPPADDPAQPEE